MSEKMKNKPIEKIRIKTLNGYEEISMSNLAIQDCSPLITNRFTEIEATLDATVKIPQLNNYYTKGDINRLLWKHGGKR